MQPLFIFSIIVQALLLGTSTVSAKALTNPLESSSGPDQHTFKNMWADQLGSLPRDLPPPPQYMLSLYNSVTDKKAPNPYEAKVIRSYTDKESTRGSHFSFNISGLGEEESVLEAELHLYIMKNSGLQAQEIRVYQILDLKKRLIDVRHMGNHGPMDGWQIFRVKSAVLDWIEDSSSSSQLEFWVTAVTALSQPVHLRVSRRRDRHANHQPVLVLFNDIVSSAPSSNSFPVTPESAGVTTEHLTRASGSSTTSAENKLRQRRDTSSVNNGQQQQQQQQLSSSVQPRTSGRHQHHQAGRSAATSECRREELYVDFESIGWSDWIIAPKGYNAYHCSGTCSFPLGQNQRPTNHATVQSIVHEMRLTENVGQPCCVPNRLLSLSLLFYDEYDNVVLKQFEEMVADSCGCL